MRRILRKILAGEEDQLGDVSTVSLLFLCLRFNCRNRILTRNKALGPKRSRQDHRDGSCIKEEVDEVAS